jgi:hypothetical protein
MLIGQALRPAFRLMTPPPVAVVVGPGGEGHGTNTTAMESQKQKLNDRGRGPAEPADVRIGREIAGKVGNSKKVVIR